MPRQLSDKLLRRLTLHTNYMSPDSPYIKPTVFPTQNKKMLGTTVTMPVRDMYKVDKLVDEIPIPEAYDPNNVYQLKVKILRFDSAEPYITIGVTSDYEIIVVNDSRTYTTTIAHYPLQMNEIISETGVVQYPESTVERDCIVLRCDYGEPCYSVIGETYTDGSIRFILGDERYVKMNDDINLAHTRTNDEVYAARKKFLEGAKIYGVSN